MPITRWVLLSFQRRPETPHTGKGGPFSERARKNRAAASSKSIAGVIRLIGFARGGVIKAANAVDHDHALRLRSVSPGSRAATRETSGSEVIESIRTARRERHQGFQDIEDGAAAVPILRSTKAGSINAAAYRAFLLTSASSVFSKDEYWRIAERNLNFVLRKSEPGRLLALCRGWRARLCRSLPHLFCDEGARQDSHAHRSTQRCGEALDQGRGILPEKSLSPRMGSPSRFPKPRV